MLDGWGIHLSPSGGWTWNLWGFDCVDVTYKKGRKLRAFVFTMIANHFPGIYGGENGWLAVLVIFLMSGTVKHFMNISGSFRHWLWASLATVAVSVVLLHFLTSKSAETDGNVSFAEVRAVLDRHCVSCHSAKPTDTTVPVPAGVWFDTPGEIKRHASRIRLRAVETLTMPLGNKTGMTREERDLLGRWIAQGADIDGM